MPLIVNALDGDGQPWIGVSGSAFNLDYVLTKDGTAYNLTGKTVVCTVREEGSPQTAITGTTNFEDRSITPGGGTTAAANGGCYNAVSAADSAFLGPSGSPSQVDAVTWYIVQTKVTTDSFKAVEVLRFGIRKDID